MKKILAVLFLAMGFHADAQISGASLQASGLTCSMCSKAVKNALEEVSFVEKIQVDIKNQQYNLSFKEGADVDPDVLAKAVEDAGFSVASLKVTARVEPVVLEEDAHLMIGNRKFHFLNGKSKQLNGTATFSLVDRNFVSAKEFKKYSALSRLPCVKTGKMEGCCSGENLSDRTRIYHVIL